MKVRCTDLLAQEDRPIEVTWPLMEAPSFEDAVKLFKEIMFRNLGIPASIFRGVTTVITSSLKEHKSV